MAFKFDIVGESFYTNNLISITNIKAYGSVSLETEALVELDDNNTHDINAVKVSVDGLQVGHFPGDKAKRFRKFLQTKDIQQKCFPVSCQIGGSHIKDDQYRIGVRLDIDEKVTGNPDFVLYLRRKTPGVRKFRTPWTYSSEQPISHDKSFHHFNNLVSNQNIETDERPSPTKESFKCQLDRFRKSVQEVAQKIQFKYHCLPDWGQMICLGTLVGSFLVFGYGIFKLIF